MKLKIKKLQSRVVEAPVMIILLIEVEIKQKNLRRNLKISEETSGIIAIL